MALKEINEESDIQLELEFTGRGAYRKVESLEAVSWNIPNWSLFDNAGLPTTKPRDSALRAVTKEVVGIRVLLTRLLFGDGIPRKLLRRLGQVDLSGTI